MLPNKGGFIERPCRTVEPGAVPLAVYTGFEQESFYPEHPGRCPGIVASK